MTLTSRQELELKRYRRAGFSMSCLVQKAVEKAVKEAREETRREWLPILESFLENADECHLDKDWLIEELTYLRRALGMKYLKPSLSPEAVECRRAGVRERVRRCRAKKRAAGNVPQ